MLKNCINATRERTRRLPISAFVVLLFVVYGMLCLPLWPVPNRAPSIIVDAEGRPTSVVAWQELHHRDGQLLSPRSWRRVEGRLVGNATTILFATIGVVLLTTLTPLRRESRFPVRDILLGVIMGCLLEFTISGIVRMAGWSSGNMNLLNPASFMLVFYCLALAMAFVLCPRDEPQEARCIECGYMLCGLPNNVCPECGTVFAIDHPERNDH